MQLSATLEAPPGQADAASFQVILRITNPTGAKVSILNPNMGVPSPTMNWPSSQEVYQTAMLLSFGYLSMSVTDEKGQQVPRQAIQTWATPALQPRLELAPGASFELKLPLGGFHPLEAGKTYEVAVEYGDPSLKVPARARVTVP